MEILSAVWHHAYLAVTFRSNGKGLPTRPSSSFWFLVACSLLVSIFRLCIVEGQSLFFAVLGDVITLVFLSLSFRGTRFVFVPAFLAVSIGIDAFASLSEPFLPPATHWLLYAWGLAAYFITATKVTNRLRAERVL